VTENVTKPQKPHSSVEVSFRTSSVEHVHISQGLYMKLRITSQDVGSCPLSANLPNGYSALCWRPVTHAQTFALYRFGRLSPLSPLPSKGRALTAVWTHNTNFTQHCETSHRFHVNHTPARNDNDMLNNERPWTDTGDQPVHINRRRELPFDDLRYAGFARVIWQKVNTASICYFPTSA